MGKSLFWGVLVSLVALAAYVDARGITSLVQGELAAPAAMLARPPPAYETSGPSCAPSPRDAAAILAQNPFESAPPPSSVEPAPPMDPRHAAPCDGLAVRVIAYADDPRGSLASLWDTRAERSLIRARGGDVNGQEVAFIGRDQVWLARGSSYCRVDMYSPPPASAPVATVPVPRTPAAPAIARPLNPAIAKQIQKRGPNDFAIDRGLVERTLDDPAELMKLAHTVPVKVDGQMVGVRLKGVRPESLLGAIGLQDGDVLERINGYELTSSEAILGAYAHLREAQSLALQVTRGGRKVSLDYAIR